jgi:flagella basal body P-ring formation protein FlgA
MKCTAPTKWALYLTYQVHLTGPSLTALHPLPARHLLGPGDVTLTNVRYEQDPGSYLREIPAGAVTQRPMNANQPILVYDLILPDVIQAGAKVRVRAQGRGFSVAQEGKALNAAKAGGTVQVKMPTGRIVRGMANQAGEVEIRP